MAHIKKNDFCDCDAVHDEIVHMVSEKMPAKEALDKISDVMKTIADPTRLNILYALSINEMCVCDLAVLLDMSKSAISHQLKYLRKKNYVTNRKVSTIVYYQNNSEIPKEIMTLITKKEILK